MADCVGCYTGATVFIYRGHGGKLVNRVNAVGWSPDGKHHDRA